MLDVNDTKMNRMGPRLEELLVGCGGSRLTMATALHALGVALGKPGEVSTSVRKDCLSRDGGTFTV